MGVAIGICSAVERVRWGAWEETVTMAPRSYATAVQAAGAIALLLPPDDAAAEAPDELLDRIDGLMLAGGCDVDPASYGARPHPETKGTWPSATASSWAWCTGRWSVTCPCWGSAVGCRCSTWPRAAHSSSTCPTSLGTQTTATPRAPTATTRCGWSPGRWPPGAAEAERLAVKSASPPGTRASWVTA